MLRSLLETLSHPQAAGPSRRLSRSMHKQSPLQWLPHRPAPGTAGTVGCPNHIGQSHAGQILHERPLLGQRLGAHQTRHLTQRVADQNDIAGST
jgi:hypothetical protein